VWKQQAQEAVVAGQAGNEGGGEGSQLTQSMMGGPGSVAAQAHNQLAIMYMQGQAPKPKQQRKGDGVQCSGGNDTNNGDSSGDSLGVLHFLVAASDPLGTSTDARSNIKMLMLNRYR
jgi:hypothetical protein